MIYTQSVWKRQTGRNDMRPTPTGIESVELDDDDDDDDDDDFLPT